MRDVFASITSRATANIIRFFRWIKPFVGVAVDKTIEIGNRCALRLALWSITIFGGLVPSIYAADTTPSFNIRDMAARVNEAGLFRARSAEVDAGSAKKCALKQKLEPCPRCKLIGHGSRDFFYIIVVIGLVGICEIVNEFFRPVRPNRLVLAPYAILFASFLYFVLFEVIEFGHLATGHAEKFVLPGDRFDNDLSILVNAGVCGVLLEVLLAFRAE